MPTSLPVMGCRSRLLCLALLAAAGFGAPLAGQQAPGRQWIREHYRKDLYRVPMRDGTRLFTIVYRPRDESREYPILLKRTPYGLHPYGKDDFPASLGPSPAFARAGYIFAYQDVRGRYMSEGEFVNMRPVLEERAPRDTDESTDSWDTIAWLLEHVPGHNGRVGMWGISYPGFYAAAGMIRHHPALVAVSPQAPIADWFFDDFHHHGAFFLPHAFGFLSSFGLPREGLTTRRNPRFSFPTRDGYRFFLELGPLANADARWFHGRIPFWRALMEHPDYDDFWQARNLLPHLQDVAPAVLVVGGWFDAEDLYGTFHIYQAVEAGNPGVDNRLVVGPWPHGGWAYGPGDRLGRARFGSATAAWYREEVGFPFFEHHLRGGKDPELAEATVFETGRNRWRRFTAWPPAARRERHLYLLPGGELGWQPPGQDGGASSFPSDPARPVPYTRTVATGMVREYMTEDQAFCLEREDVLSFTTGPLEEDLTLAGPLRAELTVSTTGTDADWVVKVVDVFPEEGEDPGYHMLVRSEVFRGRYRNSYSRPEPFAPGEPTPVVVPLQDVLHTFRRGHRLQVQIQSTWFPLVDRNPQIFVASIYAARPEDFRAAEHRVWHEAGHLSALVVPVLSGAGD